MESAVKTDIDMVEDIQGNAPMEASVRYKGKWFKIIPKRYESERQTFTIAWKCIQQSITPEQAYREWFEQERKDAKLLYPSFGKNGSA